MQKSNIQIRDKMQRDIWTPQDVAEYLMVTPEMVTKMARNGDLQGTRVGVLWRFHRQTIMDFMGR